MSNMISMLVGGVDTYADLGWAMEVEELSPPAPKYYTVDVPGGDGRLNLTGSLYGDTAYSNRTMRFTLTDCTGGDFEARKTQLSNMVHGRELPFSLSFDPGYEYRGWFTVSSYERKGCCRQVSVEVDAEPYKSRGLVTEAYNVTDGITAYFDSGRKRVRPVFEFSADTVVTFEGGRYVVPAGAHTVNDVWFSQGQNEVTFVLAGVTSHMTHGEMAGFTHAQLARKRNWQIYKGVEKHSVSRIVLEGTDPPTSGDVVISAEDGEGGLVRGTLALGDVALARIEGGEADTVTISDGVAVVRKVAEVAEDGSVEALPLPQSVSIPFPELFSGSAPIASVSSSPALPLSYETASINVELEWRRASHADYAAGGALAATHASMAGRTHAQLSLVCEGEHAVAPERAESVYVQYEWKDL